MLAQHGGLAGVRDEGLLESALSKPQNLFAYSSPTLTEMAASYAAGISSTIRSSMAISGQVSCLP